MMKKLLVLILVLGMTSTANATLSLVVGDGTTFTDPGSEITIIVNDTLWIGINDDIGVMYTANISNVVWPFCEWTGNSAVYSPPAISTAPGWDYGTNGFSEWWYVNLEDPDTIETPLPGVGGAVEFRGLDIGKVAIVLNATPGGVDDGFYLHIVPEPATLLLLGLGSLALLTNRRFR